MTWDQAGVSLSGRDRALSHIRSKARFHASLRYVAQLGRRTRTSLSQCKALALLGRLPSQITLEIRGCIQRTYSSGAAGRIELAGTQDDVRDLRLGSLALRS